jgi:predicted transcriptional regulator
MSTTSTTAAAFRLTTASAGLAKLLPTAEIEIMRVIWAHGPLKGRVIHAEIAARRDVAYTTVMTTCVRLAEKGLLHREMSARGYGHVYTATVGEREFVTRELAGILDSVARDYPSALMQYLDARSEQAAG